MIGFLKIPKDDFISKIGVKKLECLYINFDVIQEIRQCKDYCKIVYKGGKMLTVKGNFENLIREKK